MTELASTEAEQSPNLIDGLQTLRHLVRTYEAPRIPSTHHGDRVDTTELLPSEFALQVLRVVKGTESTLFLFNGFHDRAQIEDLCKHIYFPLVPLSIGDLALYSGAFTVMLGDLDLFTDHGLNRDDVKHFRNISKTNFQANLETWDIMAIPTYEHVLALCIATINAQREGNLVIQWSLTSTAARHCLALGFHREERLAQMSALESDRIRKLFWTIYTSDKNLSLRLGRPSSIPDYDLDIKACSISPDPGRAPWDRVSVAFVSFSRIQAQIYEGLYSASASSLDTSERQRRVSSLSTALSRWYGEWQRIDSSSAYQKRLFETTFGPTSVVYYSVLTLLYRGLTSSNSTADISADCFETARQGLKAHLKYYGELSSCDVDALATYSTWLYHYSSFTPYVVTFMHCIGNADKDDLRLLKDVLDSLEQIGRTVGASEGQPGFCRALYQIAEAFIDSRKTAAVRQSPALEETVVLPLQPPFNGNLACFDSNWPPSANDWSSMGLDADIFLLNNRLGLQY